MTVRAFVAMPLPPTMLEVISNLQQELQQALPRARWAKPETIHLTLAFLGDLGEESLEKLGSSMLSIGDLYPPVTANFFGIDAFPSRSRARVIWLGLDGGDILLRLHADLKRELQALQLPIEERQFVPHLTIGRLRQPIPGAGPILETFAGRDCGRARLDRLVLYESRLRTQGALHLPRCTVLLGGSQPRGDLHRPG